MSEKNFTTSPASDKSNKPTKPEKPRPDFSLFAHAAGVWAKKIRGKLHYFGPWSDPQGASDCGNLPLSAVNLHAAIIDFPRPKTGIPRRCPLWPEAVQALRDSLAKRPEPKNTEHVGLFFVTRCGDSWMKDVAENPLSDLTAKLLKKLGINGRAGLSFYTLRHTFRTIADEAKDQPAADYIMGHESPHMSSVYRERISDERLKAVTNHVHTWLFTSPKPVTIATEVAIENTQPQN